MHILLECVDGDVFEFYFGFAAGVDLDGDNAFGGNFWILFDVVNGLNSIDVKFVLVALTANDVGVPAVFFEDVFEGVGVGFDE